MTCPPRPLDVEGPQPMAPGNAETSPAARAGKGKVAGRRRGQYQAATVDHVSDSNGGRGFGEGLVGGDDDAALTI